MQGSREDRLGADSEDRLQGMEEMRREGGEPEYFAPFIAYLAATPPPT